MTTNRSKQIWNSLKDKEYRELFATDVGTNLAFQIRLLRTKQELTQDELADRTGKKQETISQLENPGYGRYSLQTLQKLANAFDVALQVRFVSFSEYVEFLTNLSEKKIAPKSFEEDSIESVITQAAESGAWFVSGGTAQFQLDTDVIPTWHRIVDFDKPNEADGTDEFLTWRRTADEGTASSESLERAFSARAQNKGGEREFAIAA